MAANSVMRFRLLIGALIISLVAPLAWGAETKVVILHTNDLHGHITSWQGWEGDLAGKTTGGFDRLASRVSKSSDGIAPTIPTTGLLTCWCLPTVTDAGISRAFLSRTLSTKGNLPKSCSQPLKTVVLDYPLSLSITHS
ncbi:hypothetical protein [Nitrosospira multiformis]|uniref:hypothetical protein n=1 Tax=Nitrosospira multiformis TaxID=1231 RepID=UPI00089CCB6D|nr:hypothetical protein [Nitrosospira multiformis]SDZ93151.1 hypothetical protein SAMN05216411_10314 [Nitrosospira multiformis]